MIGGQLIPMFLPINTQGDTLPIESPGVPMRVENVWQPELPPTLHEISIGGNETRFFISSFLVGI